MLEGKFGDDLYVRIQKQERIFQFYECLLLLDNNNNYNSR